MFRVFFPVVGILVLASLVLLPLLLPVAASDPGVNGSGSTSNGTFNELDRLSMGHVQVCFSTEFLYFGIKLIFRL